MPSDDSRIAARETLLTSLTSIPTASGREERIVDFLQQWVDERPAVRLDRDETGNLWITRRADARRADERGPVIFEAHLDHPAFVVDAVESPSVVRASFRGGVLEPYFRGAAVTLHQHDERIAGMILDSEAPSPPDRLFRVARIELERAANVRIGDLLTWSIPPSQISDGLLHAPVCDDLAAVSAALSAFDELLSCDDAPDVRLFFTLAEEVGFVGAIGACRSGAIPPGARIIALENSRSFADSPLGAGPIVRVGDRLSVFSPALTAAVAGIAQQLTGEAERPVGQADKPKSDEATAPRTPPLAPITNFNWQRRLMPGGACEATAFCAFGHEATCLCLPLRNYHNMGDLETVEAQIKQRADSINAPIAPEVIAISDYHNLIELLIACAHHLGAVEPMTTRLEKLYDERAFVLQR